MKNTTISTLVFVRQRAVAAFLVHVSGLAIVGCGGGANSPQVDAAGMPSGGATGTGGGSAGGAGGSGATGGAAGASAAQTCVPPANREAPPVKLSQTGCVDPARPTSLAASVISYEVNSPLWSDGADKTRGMALPVGARIHATNCTAEPTACPQGPADDGKWAFPIGTVMVKSFLFDEKLVETRLFVRFDQNTWIGYSYQWDEEQTDATIVPDDRLKISFNTGKRQVDWTYPNRIDCMKCHASSAGSTLGPETAQMNRIVSGMNQIDRLAALGLFDAPLAKPYKTALVNPYPSQAGNPPTGATLDQRARSYLHANCAGCHRPEGDFPNLDLRHDISLKDTKICGATPAKGDVGVPESLVFDPGKPTNSGMWLRMNSREDKVGMPQIATYVVDTEATKLIGDWITSIGACPP